MGDWSLRHTSYGCCICFMHFSCLINVISNGFRWFFTLKFHSRTIAKNVSRDWVVRETHCICEYESNENRLNVITEIHVLNSTPKSLVDFFFFFCSLLVFPFFVLFCESTHELFSVRGKVEKLSLNRSSAYTQVCNVTARENRRKKNEYLLPVGMTIWHI